MATTVRFEQILSEGVAQCSYLVGDDAAGVAAVVDPRPDVGIYLALARRYGLAITHVLETHVHADFMSGSCELVDRLAGSAGLFVSTLAGAEYGFAHQEIADGDRFAFGDIILQARATPGHSPEHLSFLLYHSGRSEPWGVLSGDSLLVGSVGRPDLLGAGKTESLVDDLFHTMRDFYSRLDDGVIVYPCHAAGSACGPDIGDRLSSTIGYERRHNPYLSIDDLERFRQVVTEGAPPVPTHYPRMKTLNAAGPPVLGGLPRVPAMLPDVFADAVGMRDAQLLDTRDMLAFGGGHIEGALSIGARPDLSVWAGWLLDPVRPLYLVIEDEERLDDILVLLVRVGFTNFAGYLAGGMTAWRDSGRPLSAIPQMPAHELDRRKDGDVLPLDVRRPGEWQSGHIPGARHIFLGELRERLGELDRKQPIATYCGSGFRSSIAASILAAAGFRHVHNVPGSWRAWKAAGYDVVPDRPRREAREMTSSGYKSSERT